MPYTAADIGYRNRETSEAAACSMEGAVPSLRAAVLIALQNTPGGLTADEIAAKIGASILSIRPRVTELSKAGIIIPSCERRMNVSGRRATVWCARGRS